MLETEEVDKDYFTPAASTSLANIFDSSSKPEQKSGNDSLRYTPPKAQVSQEREIPKEDKVGLEPIFKCLLIGHQWVNNVYSAKGKIGCSVVKVTKDPKRGDVLFMVLYDSNKHTLLSISLTPKLQITVKEMQFVSFYESYEKFWSLHGSQDDIKKLLDYCQSKNVQLKYSEKQETGPLGKEEKDKSEAESETESDESGNKIAKASILSRMANMGKAVLPHRQIFNEDSSSSCSEADHNSIIQDKFQSIRDIAKRDVTERNIVEDKKNDIKIDPDPNIENSTDNINHDDNELMLLQYPKTSSIDTTTSSANLFLTEQRISNSELRINISRVSDKIEKVLTKMNELESKTCNMNTEILLKLLKEYESKIKMYENILEQKNDVSSTLDVSAPQNLLTIRNENTFMKAKIKELESLITQKDEDILLLHSNIEKLKNNFDAHLLFNQEKQELLTTKSELEKQLLTKNELLGKLTMQNEQFTLKHNDALSNQIKSIMNYTYHGIVENFNQEDKYSGEDIRNIVEKVIKNVTIGSLKNLKAPMFLESDN